MFYCKEFGVGNLPVRSDSIFFGGGRRIKNFTQNNPTSLSAPKERVLRSQFPYHGRLNFLNSIGIEPATKRNRALFLLGYKYLLFFLEVNMEPSGLKTKSY
jgi:hypothetical protein